MNFNNTKIIYSALLLVSLLLASCGGGGGSPASATGTSPAISSFTPTSGAAGTAVTITGTNFSATAANNTVSFNSVPATVTSATATQLIAMVPATATSGTITVTAGGLTATSATGFIVTAAAGGGGETLTLSPPFTSISGLNYNATFSASVPTATTRIWTNAAADMVAVGYYTSASEDFLSVTLMPASKTIFAGTNPTYFCHITGPNPSTLPLCTSWGVAINRVAGTITFTSTPVYDNATYQTGTMSGSLTFAPF